MRLFDVLQWIALIETWLRGTMNQERLNSVAVCHVGLHQEYTDSVVICQMVNEFALASDRRLQLFGQFD